MAENSDTMLPLSVKLDNDGQLFSKTARLASSYMYDFTCIQNAHVQVLLAKKWLGQNLTSPTACYSHEL